jgi:hypothetical protein
MTYTTVKTEVLQQVLDALCATPDSSLSLTRTLRSALQADKVEPVARVNRQGFIVEMDSVQMAEGTLLYMHPAPAVSSSQKETADLIKSLWQLVESINAGHYAVSHHDANVIGEAIDTIESLQSMLSAAPTPPTNTDHVCKWPKGRCGIDELLHDGHPAPTNTDELREAARAVVDEWDADSGLEMQRAIDRLRKAL